MTFSRIGCSWLLLGTLLTAAVGCDEDGTADPPGPASVQLLPSMVTYGVGESVVVEVHIGDATNVGAVTFRLRYGSAVLDYVGAVEGTFMNGDGSHTVFLASPAAGDEIVVALSRLGNSQGASGSGLLATLEFLAVEAGDAGFAFTGGQVQDPQAQDLPAVFSSVPVLVVP